MPGSERIPATEELRERLRAAIDEVDVALAGDEELLRHTAELEALGRLLDAARVRIAGELAERSRSSIAADGLAHRLGCRGPAELLERVAKVSSATARLRMRAAAPLRTRSGLTGDVLPPAFPEVARVLSAGALGVDSAAAIIGALAPIAGRCADPAALAAAETELVQAAVGGPGEPAAAADEIAVMARTWALYLDPDGALPDEERGLRMREVTLGRERDGVVRLHGDLLPEVAAQLQRLLDAFANPKVTSAPGPRFEPEPLDREEPIDRRTPRQLRHDAFASILTIAAGADGMPLLGGAPPTLVVTVSAEDLARPGGVAFLPSTRPGETGATSAAAARHVGCAGQIQRLVLSASGRILELGAPQRIFTAHQRRAIAARDGECVISGCHVPAAWCEIHHVEAAARGGPTHTDNGVLLCWFHHRTIESSGWEIRMIRGAPWIKPPRWIDHTRRWRPAAGSPQRTLQALAGAPPG